MQEDMPWEHFLHDWFICEGNPPVTGGFPSQRANMIPLTKGQ